MSKYVIDLRDIDRTQFMKAGGKAANLGELYRIDGIRVPEGFCITTQAYSEVIRRNGELSELLDELSFYEMGHDISHLGERIRGIVEALPLPGDIEEEIRYYITRFGRQVAFAVRSSATAEDLPTASFAGQQDSFLNIVGEESILRHVKKCWASLFTDRAIIYRKRNEFDHHRVYLAVVVQRMVFSQVSGIMFTADPVSLNRKILSIDAGSGLGDQFVSGLVSADNYKVKEGRIVGERIAAGRGAPPLSEQQVLELERTGRKIEAYFDYPQDIEWCLAEGEIYIVQSRPITTLYPVPAADDQGYHVYVSVGHQQMMTDAMKPLGLSIYELTAVRPRYSAGGRLFVDVAPELASPAKRDMLLGFLGKHDPLITDALQAVLERGDIVVSSSDEGKGNGGSGVDLRTLNDYDPTVVSDLIAVSQASLVESKRTIGDNSGSALMELILEDIRGLKSTLFDPRSFGVIMTAMNAASWINDKMNEWLDEKGVADILTQSVENNITSEMGLDLLGVADVIRPYPLLVAYLENVKEEDFMDRLGDFEGGAKAREAIRGYLEKYGMRCAGEIDVTRPRWSEKPAVIVPMLLNNIKNFEHGAGDRKFRQGRQEAFQKEQSLLGRLRLLPDGEQKVHETKRMIDLVRNLSGYREYPKYDIVNRYFIYKQALLGEAGRLVSAGIMDEKEDIYYLSFAELREAIRTSWLDRALIDRRKEEFRLHEKLTPPRVMTSDGEVFAGKYRRGGIPAGALAGLAVSAGVIEGRARVILNIGEGRLEEGDILVTTFTDPSWTPLFISIKGLVAEVGGLMTHGAVIAREYGLPAVVGVENATRLIRDGQRIRVNGTEGYIEFISEP
jgi:pyruvate,water dikinase